MDANIQAKALMLALRSYASENGSMTGLAARAGVSRETLYNTFGPAGNPRLKTLMGLCNALGLKISLVERRGAMTEH